MYISTFTLVCMSLKFIIILIAGWQLVGVIASVALCIIVFLVAVIILTFICKQREKMHGYPPNGSYL